MDLTQIIGSLGFPIVCCIILFKQNQDMLTRHHEEIEKISESINNNTVALTKLADKIEDSKQ